MAKGRHGETKSPVPRFDATSLDKLARQAMRHISTTPNHHILSRRNSLTDWLLRHCIPPWSLELDAVQRALDDHEGMLREFADLRRKALEIPRGTPSGPFLVVPSSPA